LGGSPFNILLQDPDVVSQANLARQVFCEADIGQSKAQVLAQRAMAFFGIEVEAETEKFTGFTPMYGMSQFERTLVVGCVDNITARRQFEQVCKPGVYDRHQGGGKDEIKYPGTYWLDLGNSMDSGQVVLGGHGLPSVFDVLPQLKTMRDPKDLPSCSMAESLARQDLFINSTLATLAGQLLWQLMRKGGLNHHGFFVNLNQGRVAPIEIK
jgi:PRTRC genetic system ThiF family protein